MFGLYYDNGVSVSDCRFEGNQAAQAGAAFIGGAEVSNTVFVGNRALESSGGAVVATGAGALFDHCRFEHNRAAVDGGALSIATGGWEVRNSVFWGNVGDRPTSRGAAIFGARLGTVVGNTFVGHTSQGVSGGAVIHFRSGINFTEKTDFSNNVVAGTTSSEPAVFRDEYGEVIDACNIYWNNAGGDASGFTVGTSSRVVDPLFCTGAGEFAVSTASPALPSGSGGCGLIGAFAAGCGPVSVESASWGQVKAAYWGTIGAGREPGRP